MAKSLYLIDGSSYFFRAYYAIQNLSNSEGIPTNATYGFVNMLNKVIDEYKPDYIAMVFDAKGPSFRKEIYQDYKANREEMPEDLSQQIPFIKEIVRAHRIFALEKPKYEADDIIATLVKRYEQEPVDITIVSSDKDLMQLVTPNVTMLDTMKDIRYGIEEVKEKWGVEPQKVLEILSLTGDSSDNIPGVPGIGPKTAKTLIQEFGTLENLIDHADQVKGKSKSQKLKEFSEQAFLSKKLVTLDEKVPIECDLMALEIQNPDLENLTQIYNKLEFHKLLLKINSSGNDPTLEVLSSQQKSRENYRLLTDIEEIKKTVNEIREKKYPLSIDLETTSLDPMSADIVGISFCSKPGHAFYIPISHLDQNEIKQPRLDGVLEIIKPVLEDENIGKRGQNLKYDDVIFRCHGIQIKNIAFDSMLASYLLESEMRRGHNLDALCQKYLLHQTITYSEVIEGIPSKSFRNVSIQKALLYAGEDADMVLQLEEQMIPLLERNNLLPLFQSVEMPLSSLLAQIEHKGVLVDKNILEHLSAEFGLELSELTKKIHQLAGEEFAISSPKQLQKILFEKLSLPRGKKTKTGYSTDNEVLKGLLLYHELPNLVLRYRLLSKLKNTYVDALPQLIHPKTGRIHTRYNQAIAATGRLSSSDPNLQNIPVRGSEGQMIRSAFISPSNQKLLAADYSQIELRIFAQFSEDEALLKAYQNDEDIHKMTATAIFNCSSDEVTGDMRRKAKTINFGILYGMSEFRLARELKISNQEARDFIARYFARYPGVGKYLEKTYAEARGKGFVRTHLGRRRKIPDLDHKNMHRRKAAERVAASTPIQGSAADLIKQAMIRVEQRMRKEGLNAAMIMQVHDELIFEAPQDEIEILGPLVKEEMESTWKLDVPLKVETQSGDNWLEAHG